MGCPCKKHAEPEGIHAHPFAATAPCPFCAEKHLGQAAALARELGYEAENAGLVAGELGCASWHLAAGGEREMALAGKIRALRNAIHARTARPLDQDFVPLLREAAEMVAAALDREAAETAIDLAGGEK